MTSAAHGRGLQLESPRALTPTPITALQAPSRAGGAPRKGDFQSTVEYRDMT